MKKLIISVEGKTTIDQRLIEFFKNTPNPNDEQVHELADSIGIDPDVLENHVYQLLGSFFAEGESVEDKVSKSDVNPKQLLMGQKVEMEHTDSLEVATKIALDHLAEIPDYYSRLDEMEDKAWTVEDEEEQDAAFAAEIAEDEAWYGDDL